MPPVGETLVEGHTVFMTIDVDHYTEPELARTTARPPASSPPDVEDAGVDGQLRVTRYAGVTWFNDQYLVRPWTKTSEGLGTGTRMDSRYGAALTALVRVDSTNVREPCGGALLAVNAGDPDPRSLLLAIDGRDPQSGLGRSSATLDVRSDGSVRMDGTLLVQADGALGAAGLRGPLPPAVNYEGSYLLTDPNGHVWIVDKYLASTTLTLPDGTLAEHVFPIWASNILGGPSFVPDATALRSSSGTCLPYKGLTEALIAPVDESLCGFALVGVEYVDGGNDTDLSLDHSGAPAWSDKPCMSYQEPSRNGYCYAGTASWTVPTCEPLPPRRYHALLYFEWQDLTVAGAPRDHCNYDPDMNYGAGGCDPSRSPDTNACQSGTEWPCPGEDPWIGIPGADEREGNSHVFHPVAVPHGEAEPCQPAGGPSRVNHGGSTYGRRGVCDLKHATAAVDVYFSGSGRPPIPAVRDFRLVDTEGSSAPFFDLHSAYPGVDHG